MPIQLNNLQIYRYRTNAEALVRPVFTYVENSAILQDENDIHSCSQSSLVVPGLSLIEGPQLAFCLLYNSPFVDTTKNYQEKINPQASTHTENLH